MRDADITRIAAEMDDRGWSIGHHEDVRRNDIAAMHALSCEFGVESTRDGGPLWRVSPRTAGATFSTRSGAADLHTDAQYRIDPEPKFILFCIRAADAGGHSVILTAQDVWAGLAECDLSRSERILLQQPVWSWSTPEEFQDGTGSGYHAVLPRPGWIRWRRDNLQHLSRPMETLADRFHDYLGRHPARQEVGLESGDFLVCDNRRVLHGRTHFADPHRLLLRSRLT